MLHRLSRCQSLLLIATALAVAARAGEARRTADFPESVIESAGPATPRADCGSIVERRDGSLLVVYMKYEPNRAGTSDLGLCNIWSRVSRDRGLTWTDPAMVVETSPGDLNVQAPALLRLPSGELLLIALRAHRTEKALGSSSSMWAFRSRDDGRTFQAERPVWEHSQGQWLQGGANALVRLKSGRILLPFHGGTGTQGGQRNFARCFVSDDDGKTWRQTAANIELPRRGAMEPSVAELENGELVMSLRTQLGGPYLSHSKDAGETWTQPVPSGLEGPESCTCLRRIPGTNTLLLLWNHSAYEPKADHSGKRTPLTAATSKDGGITWRLVGDLRSETGVNYTDLSCTFLADGRTVITYRFERPAWKKFSLHALFVPTTWFLE